MMLLIDIAFLVISSAIFNNPFGHLAVHLRTVTVRERMTQIRASYHSDRPCQILLIMLTIANALASSAIYENLLTKNMPKKEKIFIDKGNEYLYL
jgi:hypothetical protein